jgi:hypothetical protein
MTNTNNAATLPLETLAKILRRLPDSKQARQALAMVKAGEVPPVELLRRAGIRTGSEVVA